MAGQERGQVAAHAHRPDAGPATAVGDAEGLVQVEVADVGAEAAGLRRADERVEVGAVEVHLAARGVHELADLTDALLEHAVRGGVRDHQRADLPLVGGELGGEVVDVDVARRVARHGDDLHARHRGRCRVGAVRRGGDEADVACAVAAGEVPVADGEQARELALRAGVGLQRDAVVAGDLHEPGLELATSSREPAVWSSGAKGWRSANSGHVTGTISVVALSFIVQLPRGIMVRSSARSRSARRRSSRSMSVSDTRRWNTSWCSGASRRRTAAIGDDAGDGAGAAPNAVRTASTCASVVSSSHDAPTRVASTRRRLIPASSARCSTASAEAVSGSTAVTVSNQVLWASATRRPGARRRAEWRGRARARRWP